MINNLQEKKSELCSVLSKCDKTLEDTSVQMLAKAIQAIEISIDEIQKGYKDPSGLKEFKIIVTLPPIINPIPLWIHCRMDQIRESKSIPKNFFIEIAPPIGELYKAPRVFEDNCLQNYQMTFHFGNATSRLYQMIKASELVFSIYHVPPITVSKYPVLIGNASIALIPLSFSPSFVQALEFVTPNGKKTGYMFDVRLSSEKPLFPDASIKFESTFQAFSVL